MAINRPDELPKPLIETLAPTDRHALRVFVENRLNLNELKDVCFDLDVDFEDFEFHSKSDFVREILSYFERKGKLKIFLEMVNKDFPDAELAEILQRITESRSPYTSVGPNVTPTSSSPATLVNLDSDYATKPFPAAGTMLGSYRLERLLGKGGMGEVWLATHTLINELRAIKLLLARFAENPKLRERFIQGEARNALKLKHHPNIVRVYDVNLYENSPYIVMEYVESGPYGSDLKQMFKAKGRMSLVEAGTLLAQVGGALQVAHEQKLIHRDVKPANILIDREGNAKLTDFGLIKDLEAEVDLTAVALSMGTPSYMSPEQSEGKATPSSDIYSLGVVIYEALAGRLPFIGDNSRAVIYQHLTATPPPLTQFVPSLPPEVEKVVLKALAKQPEERYATPADFVKAYEFALRGEIYASQEIATEILGEVKVNLDSISPEISNTPTANQNVTPIAQSKVITPNPNNLPLSPTSFVGRQAELTKVRSLLQVTKFLTLTGAGGTGKTRLSLEVGCELLPEYKDGVWFVELAPITDPKLIEQTVITVLGIKEVAGQSGQDLLLNYLKDKQLLLILDNCEHLIEAAANLVNKLLQKCREVKVLATSREALNINGETTWRVPSLTSPNPTQASNISIEKLSQYEAVQLFIERAMAAKPEFAVDNHNAPAVAEICYHLDGIPLAIELAAARIRSLSPNEIATRLVDRFKILKGGSRTAPTRQQTLEALIKWSYDLLPEAEQILWGRLAVFAGGWTLEAAEQICAGDFNGGSIEDFEVLDLLEQLVNKSLVIAEDQNDATRYRMLESIRQYGNLRLQERQETTEIQAQHAAWYAEFAEKANSNINGSEQAKWIKILETEHDNLRAALTTSLRTDFSDKQKQLENALRLGGYLWWFWYVRGYLNEGYGWLQQIYNLVQNSGPIAASAKPIYARVLHGAGVLLTECGKLEEARPFFTQSLVIRRELGSKKDIIKTLNSFGGLEWVASNYQQTQTLFEEALTIAQELGDKQSLALTYLNLGSLAVINKKNEEAESLYQQSLTIYRELKDHHNTVLVLINLGYVSYEKGNFNEATKFFQEILQINQELGSLSFIGRSLIGLAEVKTSENSLEQAAVLLGTGEILLEKTGTQLDATDSESYNKSVSILQSQLGETNFQVLRNQRRNLSVEENIKYALALK